MNPHNIVVDSGAEIIVHGNFFPHYGRSLILFLKRFYDFTTPIFPRGLKPRKRDLYIFITFPIKTSSSTSVSKK